MSSDVRPITILMADDDPDDRLLAAEALRESRVANDLRFVEDGEQLLDYLNRRGRGSSCSTSTCRAWTGARRCSGSRRTPT